jgi:hypothetical protein
MPMGERWTLSVKPVEIIILIKLKGIRLGTLRNKKV